MKHIVAILAWAIFIAGALAYFTFKYVSKIRDLQGIRKDQLEMQKTELDIKAARSTVQLASFDDIQKYDPKTHQLIAKAHKNRKPIGFLYIPPGSKYKPPFLVILLWLSLFISIVSAFFALAHRIVVTH